MTKAERYSLWAFGLGVLGVTLSLAFCVSRLVLALNMALFGATLPLVWVVWKDRH